MLSQTKHTVVGLYLSQAHRKGQVIGKTGAAIYVAACAKPKAGLVGLMSSLPLALPVLELKYVSREAHLSASF